MDVGKAGWYRRYRCRSLLACDSGGTVYDTSQKLEDSDGETHYKNADDSPNESGQLENIIYIIDQDNEVRTSNSSLSKQTLAGPNICFEDDKFNNYETCLSLNHDYHEPACGANVQYIKEENTNCDDNCKYYLVQNNDIDSTKNSTTETLDSDSFDRENFEYYCDSINLSDSVEDNSNNSNNNDTMSENIFTDNQEEAQFCNLSNFSQVAEKSLDSQDIYEPANYVSLNQEVEPAIQHNRKRKQSYKIKSDSFTELLEDDDSSNASLASEISKKKMSAYGEDDQRKELHFQKYNPFENLKMSSILKKEYCAKSQVQMNDCKREALALSSDGNFEQSNASSKDEVFNCRQKACQTRSSSRFPLSDRFFKATRTSVRLNTDLTRADYLEYVQPREKIIESDMDKLLSPTIAVEISAVSKHCEVSRFGQQKQGQTDCNGNDVHMRENFNQNTNSKISSSEAIEKQLVSKAVYAIKLGFQNIFNTSNECVIDEILFDHSFFHKDIQLEIDLTSIGNNPKPKIPPVLLKNIDECLTFGQRTNDPFKSVSCSVQVTPNKCNNSEEFVKLNQTDKLSRREVIVIPNEPQDVHHHTDSNVIHKQSECIDLHPYSSFNSSMSANPVTSDINANYDSAKCVSSINTSNKRLIVPLKMKIKRVSDDNQYVIDDSSTFNVQVDNEMTVKSQKNSDSKYECSYCSEKFRTKKLLKSHISENHKGPYDLECDICHMKAKKSSAYKKHKPWCERSTALKCEVCQKVYCYKAVLMRHMNTHKDWSQKKNVMGITLEHKSNKL